MEIPSVGQIISLVGFGGLLFGLGWKMRQGLIDTLCERIKHKEDEINGLEARLETPSELQAKMNIILKAHDMEKAQLEKDKQKAIEEGNTALEKEKADKIQKLNQWAKAYKKIGFELEEYKKADAEREAARKAFDESFKQIRLTDIFKGPLDPSLSQNLKSWFPHLKSTPLSMYSYPTVPPSPYDALRETLLGGGTSTKCALCGAENVSLHTCGSCPRVVCEKDSVRAPNGTGVFCKTCAAKH